ASGTISTILNKVTSVMATDNSGSLYFANINEHKIYKFTTTGVLSHIAGTGVMAEVEPGVWAFFTGDLNQDEFIDGNDFPAFDNDSFNGVAFEYKATDLNGDGFVDANDFPVFDNNSFSGVSSIHP
ncbi:MAG: hypothetical protein ABIO04_07345, partial [Ferruginibacter sp.]